MKIFTLTCLMVVLAMLGVAAYAQVSNVVVSIDENGNGLATLAGFSPQTLPGFLAPDPFPGGAASALTYQLPVPVGLGDLFVFELANPSVFSDILRFNPNGQIVVYSDNSHGVDSLADVGLRTIFQQPYAFAYEATDGVSSWIDYTPTAGQPGYISPAEVNGNGLTYHFVSDSGPTTAAVPELPAPLLGSICGLCGLLWKRRK